MNGRRFSINRNALLIKAEYAQARGFVAFAIDCRATDRNAFSRVPARDLARTIAVMGGK